MPRSGGSYAPGEEQLGSKQDHNVVIVECKKDYCERQPAVKRVSAEFKQHQTRFQRVLHSKITMQAPNRMGLGMRPVFHGQGPPIGSLPPSGVPGFGQPGRPLPGPGVQPGSDKLTTVFVGSISAGVTNEFLTSLFAVRAFHLSQGRGNFIVSCWTDMPLFYPTAFSGLRANKIIHPKHCREWQTTGIWFHRI